MSKNDGTMREFNQTKAVEDFLKAVFALQQDGERVSTNALKEALNLTAPSVTDMAQRLTEMGKVDYVKHRGVRLTDAGKSIALTVIRRHRLIELYLVQELGFALHEVHAEAEKLEHVVSDRFIEAVALKLNYPDFDPHGDPIPSPDGYIPPRELVALADLPTQIPAQVAQFIAHDSDLLQYTLDKGFALGLRVCILSRDPFTGPLTVLLGDAEQVTIGIAVAQAILVEPQLTS
jgi:DtxR family Mn-dependent transcriptional regulator